MVDGLTLALPRNNVFPAAKPYADRILQRILRANDLPSNTAGVWVSGCESPSASSNPPLRLIRLCRGMVALAETEDEIAFVLAHELAHIVLNHEPTERHLRNHPSGFLLGAASIGALVAGSFGAAPVVVASFAFLNQYQNVERGQEALLQDVNRTEEVEADTLALQFVAKAGYDAKSAAAILDAAGSVIDRPIAVGRGFGLEATSEEKAVDPWSTASSGRKLFPTESLASHPKAIERKARILGLAEKEQPAARSPTPYAIGQGRDEYIRLRGAALRREIAPDQATRDRNMAFLYVAELVRAKDFDRAYDVLAALPDEIAAGDRWQRAALIAHLFAHNSQKAREFADKHYQSREWLKNSDRKPQVWTMVNLASEPVWRAAIDEWCTIEKQRDANRPYCPDPDKAKSSFDETARYMGFKTTHHREYLKLAWQM